MINRPWPGNIILIGPGIQPTGEIQRPGRRISRRKQGLIEIGRFRTESSEIKFGPIGASSALLSLPANEAQTIRGNRRNIGKHAIKGRIQRGQIISKVRRNIILIGGGAYEKDSILI